MKLSSPNYLIANFNKRWPLPQPGTPDHIKHLVANEVKRLWRK